MGFAHEEVVVAITILQESYSLSPTTTRLLLLCGVYLVRM